MHAKKSINYITIIYRYIVLSIIVCVTLYSVNSFDIQTIALNVYMPMYPQGQYA